MKKITLLFVLVFLASCSKEPGNIKGNIFWKYNDYVGNKPDAGSMVVLYSLDDPKLGIIKTTTTDISGNFTFEKLKPGMYFYIAHSKNTNSCGEDGIIQFEQHSSELNDLFGFDIKTLENQINEIKKMKNEYDAKFLESIGDSSLASLKEIQKQKDLLDKKRQEFWKSIPEKIKMNVGYFGIADAKISMKIVDVFEGQTTNENIDFGITCY